ncbi:MAG: hypothetical protein JSR18_07815 [Proteobacteria bacterium]|nr:hypothetical protein [Pseudomonadota bacterium]
MKSILDPTFRYVPSAETDIRKTFSRVRGEMARKSVPVEPRTPWRSGDRVVRLMSPARYSVR